MTPPFPKGGKQGGFADGGFAEYFPVQAQKRLLSLNGRSLFEGLKKQLTAIPYKPFLYFSILDIINNQHI